MITFLNIVLLFVSLMSALSAFGGKTFDEGSEPLLDRIKPRGWLSLMCLVMALSLGIFKELMTKNEDGKTKADTATREAQKEAENQKRQADLLLQLNQAQKDLSLANNGVGLLKNSADKAQGRLDDVNEALANARGELAAQSSANLVALLANSSVKVTDIEIHVPLSKGGKTTRTVRELFLPENANAYCGELGDITVALNLPVHDQALHYAPDDDSSDHIFSGVALTAEDSVNEGSTYKGSNGENQRFSGQDGIELLGDPGSDAVIQMQKLLHQRSFNGLMYTVQFITEDTPLSAAQIYSKFTREGSNPLTIRASWDFSKKVSEHYKAKDNRLSQECGGQIMSYFSQAFDKAFIVIGLNSKYNEVVLFKLRALRPAWTRANADGDKFHDDLITLQFALDAMPIIGAGNDENPLAGMQNNRNTVDEVREKRQVASAHAN